jgi:hypothetical protein
LQNSGDCGDISRECKNTSQTHTRLLWTEAEYNVVTQRMLKTFRSKETN